MLFLESNENETLGEHTPYDYGKRYDLDDMIFFGGIIWLIFPQIICFVYFGVLPLILTGITVLAGIVVSRLLVKYYRNQNVLSPINVDQPKQKLKQTSVTEKGYIPPFPNLYVN